LSIQTNKPVRRVALPSLVAAAVSAALLAGCSYKMDRFENPVKMPAVWDAPTTPKAQAGIPKEWWKSFNSPVLNRLIEEAYKSNTNIISTEERLKQSERTFSQATDSLFPDLTGNASTSRSSSGGSGRDTTTSGSTNLSFSTSYTVDLWGVTAARYRASVATFISSKWDADLARINLAGQIARAYFTLLNNRSNLAVARQNLETTERLQRIIEARYREGILTELQLRTQENTVQNQRTSLISSEISVRQSETALGLLLGRTPQEFHLEDNEPISQLTVPEIAPWLPGELLLRRPDIAGDESALVSAKANLIAARAQLIPVTLGAISASISTNSPALLTLTDTRNFSISTGALSIATGIFNYRGRRNSYLNAKSNEFLALLTYANTIRTALKEVDDNLVAVDAALRTEDSQRLALQQSQRSFELAELQLREGTGDREDLLNAQRSLFQAQESLQRQRVSRLNSAITLYISLGGGWEGPTEADMKLMQPQKKPFVASQVRK
jgi:NodT family efflux transporter outer membrane factor (OMF) lipoprotein